MNEFVVKYPEKLSIFQPSYAEHYSFDLGFQYFVPSFWLCENNIEYTLNNSYEIIFSNLEDAILFKLRWL